jgi:asparagine synthetase B (glutamine-hydrolysing)
MCGIFLSITKEQYDNNQIKTLTGIEELLRRRGPDLHGSVEVRGWSRENCHAFVHAL